MNLRNHKFKIIGLTPLLQNSSSAFVEETGIKTAKKVTREEEAERKVWRDEKGFYHPTQAFRSAMLTSLGGKKIGKRTARAAVQAAVFCAEERMHLMHPSTGKPLTGYQLDTRMAINKQGNAIANTRPRFEEWAGVLILSIDEDMIPDVGLIESALGEAGLFPGVGSFRVAKGGTFGRFTAALI
jgi:hypothetical protein